MKWLNTKPLWRHPPTPSCPVQLRPLDVYDGVPSKEIPLNFQHARRQRTSDVVAAEWWTWTCFTTPPGPGGDGDAPDRDQQWRPRRPTPDTGRKETTGVGADTSVHPSESQTQQWGQLSPLCDARIVEPSFVRRHVRSFRWATVGGGGFPRKWENEPWRCQTADRARTRQKPRGGGSEETAPGWLQTHGYIRHVSSLRPFATVIAERSNGYFESLVFCTHCFFLHRRARGSSSPVSALRRKTKIQTSGDLQAQF